MSCTVLAPEASHCNSASLQQIKKDKDKSKFFIKLVLFYSEIMLK